MQDRQAAAKGTSLEAFDLLTALAVKGLGLGGTKQVSAMRLIALVTARYNWSQDSLEIGQKEMAALWSVDERTAKRETRRLIEAGLIEVLRPGIRGRVATYRLNRREICRQDAIDWGAFGDDFSTRLAKLAPDLPKPAQGTIVHVDFGARHKSPPAPDLWAKVLIGLQTDYPSHYPTFYASLQADAPDPTGRLQITAPNKAIADYVSSRLITSLERVVCRIFGRPLRCEIITLPA